MNAVVFLIGSKKPAQLLLCGLYKYKFYNLKAKLSELTDEQLIAFDELLGVHLCLRPR